MLSSALSLVMLVGIPSTVSTAVRSPTGSSSSLLVLDGALSPSPGFSSSQGSLPSSSLDVEDPRVWGVVPSLEVVSPLSVSHEPSWLDEAFPWTHPLIVNSNRATVEGGVLKERRSTRGSVSSQQSSKWSLMGGSTPSSSGSGVEPSSPGAVSKGKSSWSVVSSKRSTPYVLHSTKSRTSVSRGLTRSISRITGSSEGAYIDDEELEAYDSQMEISSLGPLGSLPVRNLFELYFEKVARTLNAAAFTDSRGGQQVSQKASSSGYVRMKTVPQALAVEEVVALMTSVPCQLLNVPTSFQRVSTKVFIDYGVKVAWLKSWLEVGGGEEGTQIGIIVGVTGEGRREEEKSEMVNRLLAESLKTMQAEFVLKPEVVLCSLDHLDLNLLPSLEMLPFNFRRLREEGRGKRWTSIEILSGSSQFVINKRNMERTPLYIGNAISTFMFDTKDSSSTKLLNGFDRIDKDLLAVSHEIKQSSLWSSKAYSFYNYIRHFGPIDKAALQVEVALLAPTTVKHQNEFTSALMHFSLQGGNLIILDVDVKRLGKTKVEKKEEDSSQVGVAQRRRDSTPPSTESDSPKARALKHLVLEVITRRATQPVKLLTILLQERYSSDMFSAFEGFISEELTTTRLCEVPFFRDIDGELVQRGLMRVLKMEGTLTEVDVKKTSVSKRLNLMGLASGNNRMEAFA